MTMKKFFTAVCFAALFTAAFAGCSDPVPDASGTDPGGNQSAYALTIKNESSYVLSDVKFSGIEYQGELAISSEATKSLGDTKFGYITFTRKDINISLRTAEVVSIDNEKATFIFTNSTIVVEQSNTSNQATLSAISYGVKIDIEFGGLPIVKNETVNLGETGYNYQKAYNFTVKNSSNASLLFTGNDPVKITGGDGVFSVVQPKNSEVAANEASVFTVNFNPKATQEYTAVVTVSSNAKDGDFTFSVKGSGVPPKATASLLYNGNSFKNGETIALGDVLIVEGKTFPFVITNTGELPLEIDVAGIQITGAQSSSFSLSVNPAGTIAPDRESSFTVLFKPSFIGENNASLIIPTNDTSNNPLLVQFKATVKEMELTLLNENKWARTAFNKESWFKFKATSSTQFIHLRSNTSDGLKLQLYTEGYPMGAEEEFLPYGTLEYSTSKVIMRELNAGQDYYVKMRSLQYFEEDYLQHNPPPPPPYISCYIGFTQIPIPPEVPDIELQEGFWSEYVRLNNDKNIGNWFSFTATGSQQFIHLNPSYEVGVMAQLFNSKGSPVGTWVTASGDTEISFSRPVVNGQKYFIEVKDYGSTFWNPFRVGLSASSQKPSEL